MILGTNIIVDATLSQHSLYLLKLLHHLSQFYGPKSICFRNALQDEWKKPLTFAFDKCFPHWNQPGNEGDAKLAQKTMACKRGRYPKESGIILSFGKNFCTSKQIRTAYAHT